MIMFSARTSVEGVFAVGKHETKKIRYNLLQSLNLQRPFQHFIAEARVQFEALLACKLWFSEWHWDEVFSEHLDLRVSLILPMRHI